MKPHGKRALSGAAPAVKHRRRQEDGGSLSPLPGSRRSATSMASCWATDRSVRVVCGLPGAKFWLPVAATEPRRGSGNSAGFLELRLSPGHNRVDQ